MEFSGIIAAVSSAVGAGSRTIVRMSGVGSLSIADALLVEAETTVLSARCGFISFSDLKCPCWVYLFRGPNSYTGEDLAEFHLPGGTVLAKLLLDELFRRGVRLAEAGEFTARSFFAGKMDLAWAEGVAATIAAGNESELQAARQLMAGELARRLSPMMELTAQTLALVEVGIDFTEEDVTFLPADELRRRCEQIDSDLEELLEDTGRFEELSHEPRVVLVGRPNAGKSTLMNALVGWERSVVSDVAGTTRDVLTAELDLPHGRVQLVDVAGLEVRSGDEIDGLMQQQAGLAVESADRVVLVRDVNSLEGEMALPRPADLVVISKCDLRESFPVVGRNEICGSAKTGMGMAELRENLDRLVFGREGGGAGLALNRRHIAAIEEARAAMQRAAACVVNGNAELIALELREALDALGSVLGVMTADDVLGRVFSAFCIGK